MKNYFITYLNDNNAEISCTVKNDNEFDALMSLAQHIYGDEWYGTTSDTFLDILFTLSSATVIEMSKDAYKLSEEDKVVLKEKRRRFIAEEDERIELKELQRLKEKYESKK